MKNMTDAIQILEMVDISYKLECKTKEKGYWGGIRYKTFSENLKRLKSNNGDRDALINIFELCHVWYTTRRSRLQNLLLDATWKILELKQETKPAAKAQDPKQMADWVKRTYPIASTKLPSLGVPGRYQAALQDKDDRYSAESYEREQLIRKEASRLRKQLQSEQSQQRVGFSLSRLLGISR